jgi:hypothetical protein
VGPTPVKQVAPVEDDFFTSSVPRNASTSQSPQTRVLPEVDETFRDFGAKSLSQTGSQCSPLPLVATQNPTPMASVPARAPAVNADMNDIFGF